MRSPSAERSDLGVCGVGHDTEAFTGSPLRHGSPTCSQPQLRFCQWKAEMQAHPGQMVKGLRLPLLLFARLLAVTEDLNTKWQSQR